ncbi:hypothetical protein [Blautia stercoris]
MKEAIESMPEVDAESDIGGASALSTEKNKKVWIYGIAVLLVAGVLVGGVMRKKLKREK